jgi:plastocyanin
MEGVDLSLGSQPDHREPGRRVTLEILGVNGAEHPTVIDGYDISFTVKRGQLTTVIFTAGKAGVFEYRCGIHEPSMVGELTVLPGA